jgi:hypothetical protein
MAVSATKPTAEGTNFASLATAEQSSIPLGSREVTRRTIHALRVSNELENDNAVWLAIHSITGFTVLLVSGALSARSVQGGIQ